MESRYGSDRQGRAKRVDRWAGPATHLVRAGVVVPQLRLDVRRGGKAKQRRRVPEAQQFQEPRLGGCDQLTAGLQILRRQHVSSPKRTRSRCDCSGRHMLGSRRRADCKAAVRSVRGVSLKHCTPAQSGKADPWLSVMVCCRIAPPVPAPHGVCNRNVAGRVGAHLPSEEGPLLGPLVSVFWRHGQPDRKIVGGHAPVEPIEPVACAMARFGEQEG